MLSLPGTGVRQSVCGKSPAGYAWSWRGGCPRRKGETRTTREQARMKPMEECEVPPAQQIVPVHAGLGIRASSHSCGHSLRIGGEASEERLRGFMTWRAAPARGLIASRCHL